MEYIEKIIQQSNLEIENYKEQFVRTHRNRDFISYFFIRKLAFHKFEEINKTIVKLKNWKIEFDQEYEKKLKEREERERVKLWLKSYNSYFEKVFEHIVLLEELQEIYVERFYQKIKKSQLIQEKLKRLDSVANECQLLADKYNKNLKMKTI